MKISEAAKATGLSVSNIRFYEKKGLLAPVRKEDSKYRDYSAEDIERLKLIILYRKVNLPIETIYLLFQGEASASVVLKRQEEELAGQMEMLQGAIDLCRRLGEEVFQADDPGSIDVDYYLNYVHEEEEKGRKFAQIDELLEDFSNFSGLTSALMNPLRANKYTRRIFQNIWVFRGMSALFLLLCIVIPVVRIAKVWMQGGSVLTTVFWGTWLVCFGFAFVQFCRHMKS